MPVALSGVRVSGSAPITRLPTPGTDVRLPLHMLQPPRSKLFIILDRTEKIVRFQELVHMSSEQFNFVREATS